MSSSAAWSRPASLSKRGNCMTRKRYSSYSSTFGRWLWLATSSRSSSWKPNCVGEPDPVRQARFVDVHPAQRGSLDDLGTGLAVRSPRPARPRPWPTAPEQARDRNSAAARWRVLVVRSRPPRNGPAGGRHRGVRPDARAVGGLGFDRPVSEPESSSGACIHESVGASPADMTRPNRVSAILGQRVEG